MIHDNQRDDTYSTQGIGWILLIIAGLLGILRLSGLLIA
jgi:hypothetical protein